jgi:2'-5' RNA ligase
MKSLVVYTRLPDALAAAFPPPKAGGLPVHMTLCWAGRFPQDGDHFDRACRALRGLVFVTDVALGPLNYFSGGRGRIAHTTVDTVKGDDLDMIHDFITQRFRNDGLLAGDEDFKPHVTLGWLKPGQIWTGDVPEGSWTIDTFEIRHGSKHRLFRSSLV